VVRGGSCLNDGGNVRCAYRGGDHPLSRNDYFGFRVVAGR